MTRRTTNGIRRTSGGVGRTTPLVASNIIDDFEGDLSSYLQTGDSGTATLQSGVAQSGNALELSTDGGATGLASTSGLDNYPDNGEEIEFYFQYEPFADAQFYMFTQSESDTPDGVVLDLSLQSGDFRLDDTSTTSNIVDVDSWDIDSYENTLLRCVVRVVSGDIRASIETTGGTELSQVEYAGLGFTDGGINWRILYQGLNGSGSVDTDNNTVYFDEATIINQSPASISPSNDYFNNIVNGVSFSRGDFNPNNSTTDVRSFIGGNVFEAIGPNYTTTAKTGSFAMDFDGVDDYTEGTDDAEFNNFTDLTWTGWIYPRSSSTGQVWFSKADAGDAESSWIFSHDFDDGLGPTAYLYDSNQNFKRWNTDTATFNLNEWTHIGFTYDDSTEGGQFYIDGQPVATSVAGDQGYSGPIANSNTFPRHGTRQDGSSTLVDFYDGILDQQRLYKANLTDSQMQTVYDQTV